MQDGRGESDYRDMQVGVWKSTLGSAQPERLEAAALDYERVLQNWLIEDPSMVEEGLTVIGAEVTIDARRRIDVLAIDPARRLVVIEVKPDALARNVIAQTIDYVARLQEMSSEELEPVLRRACEKIGASYEDLGVDKAVDAEDREVVGIAVGVGAIPETTRMTAYLQQHGVPIRHLEFQLLQSGEDLLLLRQVDAASPDDHSTTSATRPSRAAGEIFSDGVFAPFRDVLLRLLAVSQSLDLHPAGRRKSVMFAPAANRRRMLFTVSDDGLLYFSPDAFNEFHGTDRQLVREVFGEQEAERRPLDEGVLEQLVAELPRLLAGLTAD